MEHIPNFQQDCYALLDDCNASDDNPCSRLYTNYVTTLVCYGTEKFPVLVEQMQQALGAGYHAVSLFSYELGTALHSIATFNDGHPLAQVLLFRNCERLSSAQVDAWLASQESRIPSVTGHEQYAGIASIESSVSESMFAQAITRIQNYITAGDTYQVNYTYRLRFDAYGSLPSLYRKLRQRQPVPYGALVTMPDGSAVLSLSPELFVRHEKGHVTTRPMKGTAAASGDAVLDSANAAALAADPKNRAENIMIVDLLRNDLGRVAKLGSVKVPQLFDVQSYGKVLQMTSTVTCELRTEIKLPELLSALYPCGSITGAPKRRTMQIIHELESDRRGIYTGAIGWFDQPEAGQSIGDFCLSVPIRTLALNPVGKNGLRKGEMGIGAGIVHDSDAISEYAECRLKGQFLTGLPCDFELFETMYATRDGGCRYAERHLQRLQASARYFNFTFEIEKIRMALQAACNELQPGMDYRLRLTLEQTGIYQIQTSSLIPLSGSVKIMLAQQPTEATDLFLRHKTTLRGHYDEAWRIAESHGAFDMLFCNTNGELTEGGRSNVFIKLHGHWYTPPLSSGVLPGVMRSILLDQAVMGAQERKLSRQDLLSAEEIIVCNSLRGKLSAIMV